MSILTIELPEETMTVLQRVAQERGETIETIAREWVQTKIENEEAEHPIMKLAGIFDSGAPEQSEDDWQNDPFWQARGSVHTTDEEDEHPIMKLAGIFNSGTPDLAERHDFYLAEEIANNHADEK